MSRAMTASVRCGSTVRNAGPVSAGPRHETGLVAETHAGCWLRRSSIAVVLGGVMLIDASEGRRYAEQNVATVTEHAAATRARVEQALNARLFLVRSLIALVRSNPELTQTEFEDAAGAAAEGVPGVRGLCWCAMRSQPISTRLPATNRRSATICWRAPAAVRPSSRSSTSAAS